MVESSMESFEKRLATYKKWCFKSGTCAPDEMAKAGFYSIGGDAVQCYYCRKQLDGWEPEDVPWEEHKKHASYCPFIKRFDAPPNELTILEVLELEKARLLFIVESVYQKVKDGILQNSANTRAALDNSVARG